MEKLVFYWIQYIQIFIEMQCWLLLTFFICLHNQLGSFNSNIVQMSEKRVHQIESKNEWLLHSVAFTAKLELVFVLTFENAFFLRVFILKPTERVLVLLKNGTRDFQNRAPFKRSVCFYVTISGSFRVLLKPPTTWPTDHLPLTHRPTDHLPTDSPTGYHQLTLK